MFSLLRSVAQLHILRSAVNLSAVWLLLVLAWSSLPTIEFGSPPLAPERQRLANAAAILIADGLAQHRGATRRIVLPVMAGDDTGEVTARLRGVIVRRGVVTVVAPPLSTRLGGMFGSGLPQQLTPAQASQAAQAADADATLVGRVDLFEADNARGQLRGDWHLVDAAGQVIHTSTFDLAGPVHDLPQLPGAGGAWRSLIRLVEGFDVAGWILWGAFTLMLPLFTLGILARAAHRGSPPAKVYVVAGYAAVSMVLAVLILSIDLTERAGGGLAAATFLTSFYYVSKIMGRLSQSRVRHA